MVRAAHIILASASPRRTSILNEQLGLSVRAIPSGFAENLDKASLSPISYVQETARQKALEVYGRCEKPFKAQHERPPSLVIGADTVVVLDGEVLEKPGSLAEARRMLRKLSDAGTHSVITGVCMIYGGTKLDDAPHENTFAEITTVTFKQMSDEEINAYIATGEPMDKAGGYGIQGLGSCFVSGITGDYFNVVGARRLSTSAAHICAVSLSTCSDDSHAGPVTPLVSQASQCRVSAMSLMCRGSAHGWMPHRTRKCLNPLRIRATRLLL